MPSISLLALCACVAGAVDDSSSLRVAVLSEHHPSAWANKSCTDDSRGRIACNLQVYEAAIAMAAQQNVSLLVMPEGYGLSVTHHATTDFFEPFVSVVGKAPSNSTSPQQFALSAAAIRHGIAVVANIFVALPNGTRLIADVVYGPDGTCLATYFKHHLFPTERTTFKAGPFHPTTFAFRGHTFGLVICYEGVYPEVTGDWSQFESLKKDGADTILWSVGGEIPLGLVGGHIAKKMGMGVVASEDRSSGAVLNSDGTSEEVHDVLLAVPGYTEAKLAIRVATLAGRRGLRE